MARPYSPCQFRCTDEFGGSDGDCVTDVLQRQFARPVLSALHTVRCMPPRSDQAASICFENDRKSLSRWVSLEFEVRAPCRGDGSMPNLDVIEDTPEAHPISIKDPGAVTRFQGDRFHASKMTGHPGAQHRGDWQSPWDQVAGPLVPRPTTFSATRQVLMPSARHRYIVRAVSEAPERRTTR